jgi:uncharacterized lipoprotein YmbA
MKKSIILMSLVVTMGACASEFEISSSDVPEAVVTSFNGKYPGASDVEWEVEKEEGKLYYEAEFKLEGKSKEAHFRPDGTFSKEE